MYNVIRFQIMSSFRSFLLMIVPADLIQPKHILHCLIPCLHVFFVFTQQLEILMTVLPKHNDEHPCHFNMGDPLWGRGRGGFWKLTQELLNCIPRSSRIHSQSLPHSTGQVREDLARWLRAPGNKSGSSLPDTSVLSS